MNEPLFFWLAVGLGIVSMAIGKACLINMVRKGRDSMPPPTDVISFVSWLSWTLCFALASAAFAHSGESWPHRLAMYALSLPGWLILAFTLIFFVRLIGDPDSRKPWVWMSDVLPPSKREN